MTADPTSAVEADDAPESVRSVGRMLREWRREMVDEGLAERVETAGRVEYRYRPLTDAEVADTARYPIAALMRRLTARDDATTGDDR